MRIFIAIELPEAIKREVSALQESLRNSPVSIAWTPPQNLHLTLKFLGEIDDRALSAVGETVEQAALCAQSITLRLNATGVFPNVRNARIFWIGLSGQVPELVQLAATIDERLAGLGFAPETRPYHPHLTIGRFKSPIGAGKLLERASQLTCSTEPFVVREFVVMQSVLRPGAALYTPLHRYRFSF